MITSKQTKKHVSHVFQFIDCVHVFMCLILLDLIMLVTIIFMQQRVSCSFNLMELSLTTSYVEPSNPTICMLLDLQRMSRWKCIHFNFVSFDGYAFLDFQT
jgi:hypothetical protein